MGLTVSRIVNTDQKTAPKTIGTEDCHFIIAAISELQAYSRRVPPPRAIRSRVGEIMADQTDRLSKAQQENDKAKVEHLSARIEALAEFKSKLGGLTDDEMTLEKLTDVAPPGMLSELWLETDEEVEEICKDLRYATRILCGVPTPDRWFTSDAYSERRRKAGSGWQTLGSSSRQNRSLVTAFKIIKSVASKSGAGRTRFAPSKTSSGLNSDKGSSYLEQAHRTIS